MGLKNLLGEFEHQVGDQILNDLVHNPVDSETLYAKAKVKVIKICQAVNEHFDREQVVVEKSWGIVND